MWEVIDMQRDDVITLSNGEHATVVRGTESKYKNIYIVRLEDGDLRVVGRNDLKLVPSRGHSISKRFSHKFYRR